MNERIELDATLVARYVAGDESAFVALYEHYTPLLRTWATSWLGGCHRDDIDDIVQHVFIDFHEGRDAVYSVRGHLRNALRRHLIDYKRYILRQRRNPTRETHGYEVTDNVDPATQVEQDEANKLLRSLVARLPERERNCIEQVHLAGRSCHDYAKELNTHVNNVKRWTNEGLERLREYYHCQPQD